MGTNNYLKILQQLPNSEIKEFTTYLYFSFPRSKVIHQIHEYFAPYAIKKKEYPDLKVALNEIFTKKSTKISKLQNGLSDLFLKLKPFLIQKKHLSDEFEREFLWLKILEEKEMLHEKKLHLKKVLKMLEGNANSANTPYQKYQLQKFIYFNNQNVKREKSEHTLLDADAALDEFYFNAKLSLASEMKSMENVYGISVQPNFLHPILTHLDPQIKTRSTLNQFYFLLYQFSANQNEITYSILQDFLFKHEEKLPMEEQIIAISTLINYTVGKIKESGADFIQKTFRIYQLGLKKGVFLYRGIIDNRHYENIVNLACRVKEFDWAEEFSEIYKENLPPSLKESTFKLGKAIIAFSKGEFSKIPLLLRDLELLDIYQNLRSRILVLATSFELKSDMYLKENCESFENFVRRNKQMGEQNSRSALNFSSILKKFLKENYNHEELKKIIIETNPLFHRSWFLSKL